MSTFTTALSQISLVIVDPTLSTEEEVASYVRKYYEDNKKNVAHPFNEFMIACVDGTILKVLKNPDPAFYATCIGLDEIEKRITSWIPNTNYPELADYAVDVLTVGQSVSTPITGNNVCILTLSDKTSGTYFDLVAYSPGLGRCQSDQSRRNPPELRSEEISQHERTVCALTYSSRVVGALTHSGDKKSNVGSRTILCHSISLNLDVVPNDYAFVVGPTGYSKTPLRRFTEQNPVIMIVNHETKVLSIVPCSLDVSTVGDATFSTLLSCSVVTRGDQKYLVSNIVKPRLLVINTGEVTPEVTAVVNEVLSSCPTVEPVVSLEQEVRLEPVVRQEQVCEPVTTLQFSDCGEYSELESTRVPFHCGIGSLCTRDYPKIPLLFGECQGHPSLLLAKSYTGCLPSAQYSKIVNKSHVIVNLESDGWNYFTSNTGKNQGNCLFIVHATDEEMVNFADVKLNFLDMAGPRSLIVYENSGVYYYYRGVRYPGFDIQDFGTEILDFDEKLKVWTSSPLTWPVISAKTDTTVYGSVGAEHISVNLNQFMELDDEFVANLLTASPTASKDFIDILMQFTIICKSEDLTKVSSKVIAVLDSVLNASKQSLSNTLQELILENADIDEVKRIGAEVRNLKTTFNSKYEEILKFLHRMISQKSVVSMNHSLERAKRKLDIGKNVADTLSMKKEDLIQEQADACTDAGMVIANLDHDSVHQFLTAVSDFTKNQDEFKDSEKFVSENYDVFGCFEQNSRCMLLDSDTYGTIVEVTSQKPTQLSGSALSLVIPGIGADASMSMGIPLYDLFVNMEHPSKEDWKQLTQRPEIAHWRIALRDTLVKAHATRDMAIPPESTMLGAGLCMVLLEMLETLTAGVSSIPTNGGNMQKIIRGLLGITLTVMSSGVNSQLKAWELFDSGKKFATPATKNNWEVYQRVMRMARLAGWVTSDVLQKFKQITTAYVASYSDKVVVAESPVVQSPYRNALVANL